MRAATQYTAGGITWDNGTTAAWGATGGPYGTVWTSGNDAVFEGSGPVSVAGSGATAHNLTFNATGSVISNNTLTLNGTTPTITAGSGITATINSLIAGSAGLAKSGTGALVLGGSNTYTGSLAINAGSLSVASLADSGAGSNGTGALKIGSGANTGELIYTGGGATLARQVNLTGSTGGGKITNNGSGDLNFTNATFFSAVAAGAKTLTLQGSGNGTIAGAISSSNVGLTKEGGGTWILAGANSYSGQTTISSGTLQIGSGGTSGSLSIGSSLVNNATLAFDRSDRLEQGTGFNSTISGSGAVIQRGGGTTVFSGTNSYSGDTTVVSGTLLINGNNTGAGTVNVETNGTLGGAGSIAGAVNVSGVLAPGEGIGTLSISQSLTFSGTATARFEIDPTLDPGVNADLASATGTVTYGGLLEVLYGGAPTDFADGMVFTLFNGSAYSGSFATLTLPALADGLSWQNTLTTNGSINVIPEPSAALLCFIGVLALLRRRRDA